MNLVAVVTGKHLNKEIQILRKYKKYIYAVEIRADYFYPHVSKIDKIIKQIKSLLPSSKIILTFRSYTEGGKTKIDENTRKDNIVTILQNNHKFIDFVDIEFLSKIFQDIVQAVKSYNKKLIVSCHLNINPETKNYVSTQKVKNIIKRINSKTSRIQQFSIFKLVFNAENLKQYFNILRYVYSTVRKPQKFVIFTTGKTSLSSRIISILTSMPFVYFATYQPVISTQPTIKQIVYLASKLGITSKNSK